MAVSYTLTSYRGQSDSLDVWLTRSNCNLRTMYGVIQKVSVMTGMKVVGALRYLLVHDTRKRPGLTIIIEGNHIMLRLIFYLLRVEEGLCPTQMQNWS